MTLASTKQRERRRNKENTKKPRVINLTGQINKKKREKEEKRKQHSEKEKEALDKYHSDHD